MADPKGTLPQNICIIKNGHIDIGGFNNSLKKSAKLAILAINWSLKLCLRYMCGAKPAWLPSMCGAKSALLPSMCGANFQTLLRTWMKTMQTLLCTWKGTMQTLLRT